MRLNDARLVAFVPITQPARALAFYRDVLGLELVEESPFAVVLDAGGTTLRLTPVDDLRPQPFTVLGWTVDDVTAAVRDLAARGAVMTRYGGMEQDADGVWTTPAGARIAWFTDPDGNTLSLTQLPA